MSAPSRTVTAVLIVLAVLELATLGVLVANLLTVHARTVTQLIGPIHGAVYLATVVTVLFAPGFRPLDRVVGALPVVGGGLATWRALRRRARSPRR